MSKSYFYLDAQGQTAGPHDLEELMKLAAEGTIHNGTQLAADGDEQWVSWPDLLGSLGFPVTPANQAPVETVATTASVSPGSDKTAQIQAKVKATTNDAIAALRKFAFDPVGKLPDAVRELDSSRALGVGVAFAVTTFLSMGCAIYLLLGSIPGMPASQRGEMASAVFTLSNILRFAGAVGIVFLGLAVAGTAVRTVFSGQGNFGSDCFVSGAVLLLLGAYSLLSAIAGVGNIEIIVILGLVTLSTLVLMLYSDCTGIMGLTPGKATIAVPCMLLLTAWIIKIVAMKMLGGELQALM